MWARLNRATVALRGLGARRRILQQATDCNARFGFSQRKLATGSARDDVAETPSTWAKAKEDEDNSVSWGAWKKTTGFAFLDSILGMNNEETVRIRRTYDLFDYCLAAGTPTFYNAFAIPHEGDRAFLAFHNIVGLHVWLIFRRVKEEEAMAEASHSPWTTDQLTLFGQELYDRFWDLTRDRVRETGVLEMVVNKHLTKVQETTWAMNLDLDRTIAIKDDGYTEFGGALWRSVYRSDESVPEEHIEALVRYLIAQRTKLNNLTIEEVSTLEFDWDPPQLFLNDEDGSNRNTKQGKKKKQKKRKGKKHSKIAASRHTGTEEALT